MAIWPLIRIFCSLSDEKGEINFDEMEETPRHKTKHLDTFL